MQENGSGAGRRSLGTMMVAYGFLNTELGASCFASSDVTITTRTDETIISIGSENDLV